jgi:hypothetical protein
MTDHCSDCGAELLEGSKFCTECGKTIEQQPAPQVQPQPPQQEEPPKKSVIPPKKKKSRRKVIIGLLAIIAIVVVLVVIFLYLQGSHGSPGVADSRFVGEWEQNIDLSLRHWTLNSNSTFVINPSISPLINGTWKVNGDQLCLYYDTVCYTFVISNDGNIITLNRIGQNEIYPASITLTKKGLQGTSQTPNIECSIDSSTNRVTIDSIDPNVKWSDIRITTGNATWQVQDHSQKGLARIGTTSTITGFVAAGDSILVLDAVGDVRVTMTFLPTNAIIGNWTVNL